MKLLLQRLYDNKDATGGIMYLDKSFECFTLEDEFRVAKKNGETRIPAGTYQIKFRKALSGLTKKYRSKYNWFTYHLELQDVPNFVFVYIHIGNTDEHTDGCLLVGSSLTNRGTIQNSTAAYNKLYNKISLALENGEDVEIEIKDEINILQ